MSDPPVRPSGSDGAQAFPADARICRRADYQRIYAEGRRVSGRFAVLFAGVGAREPGVRLGITATRRVGCAVLRNRAKRRVREAFRLWRSRRAAGRSLDLVINVRETAAHAEPGALQRDVTALLDRAAGPA